MGELEKKEAPITLETGIEGDAGKLSEISIEGKHQKNKKKKGDELSEAEDLKKKL